MVTSLLYCINYILNCERPEDFYFFNHQFDSEDEEEVNFFGALLKLKTFLFSSQTIISLKAKTNQLHNTLSVASGYLTTLIFISIWS